MTRIIFCSAAMIGFIYAMRTGLHAALESFGFWPYMTICIVGTVTVVTLAFAWDRRERNHSQAMLPPERHDHQL